MSNLQKSLTTGNLLKTAANNLSNGCPTEACSYCNRVTQPDVTVTDNGICAGGDGLDGTYVWDHYELIGEGGCTWWFFLDKTISGHVQNYWLRVTHIDTEAIDRWSVAIQRDVDFGGMVSYAGTGDIQCDGSGVIDHITAAPLTLDVLGDFCSAGSEAYVTFNP